LEVLLFKNKKKYQPKYISTKDWCSVGKFRAVCGTLVQTCPL